MMKLVALAVVLAAGSVHADSFTSKEGRFTVDLPKKPDESTQPLNVAKYKLTMHLFTNELADGAILVSYVDYTDDGGMTQVERITATIDSEVKGQAGTIIGKVGNCDIAKKALCREVAYRASTGGMDLVKTFRNYLVGRRLYQVATMTLQKSQHPEQAKALFDSFKLN